MVYQTVNKIIDLIDISLEVLSELVHAIYVGLQENTISALY